MNTVALFSNRTILPGTHVTLKTLLNSNTNGQPFQIIIFADKLNITDKQDLYATYKLHKTTQHFEVRDFTPSRLQGGGTLHGNETAYGRLFLADLLPDVELCLYLDCDLIVNRSVEEIFSFFDKKHVLFADGTGKRRYDLYHDLFKMAQLDLDGNCFNTGVLGINLNLWREQDCLQSCKDIVFLYGDKFPLLDQPILNLVFADNFKAIGETLNHSLYPNTPSISTKVENAIYHFVGSPKPWDLLGKYLHANHSLWADHYKDTAIGRKGIWPYASSKRYLRISKQIFRALRDKIKVTTKIG